MVELREAPRSMREALARGDLDCVAERSPGMKAVEELAALAMA